MVGFWSLFGIILRLFRLPFPTPALSILAIFTTIALIWVLIPFVR